MAKAKGEHYVDNKAFLQEMIAWKEKCKEATMCVIAAGY